MGIIAETQLLPAASVVGFLEVDIRTATAFFKKWRSRIATRELCFIREAQVRGDLRDSLISLFPLSSNKNRFLFLETRSNWIAYFDNYISGPDVAGDIAYMARELSCRGVRMVASPETEGGCYACIWELFGPQKENQPLNCVRYVSLANDGGRWTFDAGGDEQPFEEVQNYTIKMIKERFTFEMLARYLKALGIDAFDDAFFKEDSGIIFKKVGLGAFGGRKLQLQNMNAHANQ